MRCVVCEAEVPNGEWQCQECGEHLGQWQELNQTAAEFFSEGLLFAAASEPLKAVMSLLKASVLQPNDSEVLKTLGMVLAQEQVYDAAAFYLKRSMSVAESLELPRDPSAETALATAERMQQKQEGIPQFLRLHKLKSASAVGAGSKQQAGDRSKPAESPEGTEERDSEMWRSVYGIENQWRPAFDLFAPLLAQGPRRNGDAHGAWDYLLGLFAFRAGDASRARELFRSSLRKDGAQVGPQAYLLYLAAQDQCLSDEVAALQERCSSQRTLIGILDCLSGLCLKRHELKASRALLEAGVKIAEAAEENEAASRLRAALEDLTRSTGPEGAARAAPMPDARPPSGGSPEHREEESSDAPPREGQAHKESIKTSPGEEENSPRPLVMAKENTAKK